MKMLRRSVCLLLCAALFLTLLAGCGKQEEPAEDFVVSAAVCGPLETLDPTMNTDVGAESLLSTLFEGLMRMRDDGAGKAVAAQLAFPSTRSRRSGAVAGNVQTLVMK